MLEWRSLHHLTFPFSSLAEKSVRRTTNRSTFLNENYYFFVLLHFLTQNNIFLCTYISVQSVRLLILLSNIVLSVCLFVCLSLSLSLSLTHTHTHTHTHFFRIPSWPSTLFRDFHFFFCPSNLKSQSLKKKESFIWGVDWWSENFLSQLLQISFVCLLKNKRKYKCHFFKSF